MDSVVHVTECEIVGNAEQTKNVCIGIKADQATCCHIIVQRSFLEIFHSP